ncbi:DUF2213 domain-containing protein [Pseudomonas sp.]|uniref:DUF2213 domain-containing protein n=1 Tax=Pseudomonas sp. TaxID=306 RepID=UPI0025859961|nr:DUF2213 domain-containing protein [Pseudomonas sp.]
MRISLNDRQSHQITHREYTDEGFLRVPGRVARTGVQYYLASELGVDGDPSRRVGVYRPDDEVFDGASLATYDTADVTNNHPPALVNSRTFKGVSVGVVRGPGRRDGDFVVCDLIIKDQDTIDAILSGKCELSAGYTAEYDFSPGVASSGEKYEYVQRSIKINHVAVCDRARAGANARLFDHNQLGGNTMPVLITTDSGRSVDVADPANAQVVADSFDRLTKRVTEAEAKAEKAQATADKAAEDLEVARKASSDEAIAARVTEISAAQSAARKVAGDGFTCDSLNPVEIKRAALAVARPKVAWADKSAAYVEAAFDAEMEKEEEEEGVDMSKDKKSTGDAGDLAAQFAQFVQLAKDGATLPTKDSAPTLTPYQREKQRLSQAHKATTATKGA